MKQHSLDLSKCPWTLYGTMPYAWRNALSIELGLRFEPEIGPVPAVVPGSVQHALLDAGIIPDWRYDLNSRNIEWLEHRHWIFACELPSSDDFGDSLANHAWMLDCEGLDHAGWVYVNAHLVGTFANSFVPHQFAIPKDLLKKEGNMLRIIFREPPRWLGQLGYTSRIRDWKPRYYYTWDWIPRVVQTAVTGSLMLRNTDVASGEILSVDCAYTHALGQATLSAKIAITGFGGNGQSCNAPAVVSIEAQLLDSHEQVVGSCIVPANPSGNTDIRLEDLSVDAWYPNRFGKQVVYHLHIQALDANGSPIWQDERQVGFKEVVWQPCAGAPREATPWICEVNGTRLFLQGVNWTPLSPTFADVQFAEVEKRLVLYRDMGCNLLRVWGGAVLETEAFYDACDRLGLMVWQELPLSSSGIDNWPPEDPELIQDILQIARSYIQRRMHHVSLLMYTGGNELQGELDGSKSGVGKPVDTTHPMMRELGKLFESLDARRRFLPTSPFGPRFKADSKENGMGLHWSIHGPWNVDGPLDARWETYWQEDDSLFRAETGCPGAMDPDRLASYVPSLQVFPIQQDNPVWGRNSWWIESDVFEMERGRKPQNVQEYCQWSQERQAGALKIAVGSTKRRFPAVGGIIIWMGHDSFACAANTSIIDVDGVPKPAYGIVKELFTIPHDQEG